jgi:glycosyltransferase involved in cell wall biosynthesis
MGPADARAVAAGAAPGLLPALRDVTPCPGRPVELLTRGLLDAGAEVELVTLSASVPAPVVLREGPLTVLIGPMRPGRRARDLFRAERRQLAELLGRTSGGLVHAQWTYEFAWAALADPRPAVVTVHDAPLSVLRRMPDAYRAVRALMAVRVGTAAFTGVAVSPYAAEQWRRQTGDRRTLRMIPNPVDVGTRRAARDGGGQQVRVVAVANDSGLKNVRALLAGFGLFRRRFPEAGLTLIGAGLAPEGRLAAWAGSRGLHRAVRWRGALDHGSTLDLVAAADVLAHPSLEESFGMGVAEAMAIGVPVVAGRRSGAVPWLVDGGRAGVLVDVRSPSALAAGIVAALDGGRPERVAAAAERVTTACSLPGVVERHLDLYESVTRRAGQWAGR